MFQQFDPSGDYHGIENHYNAQGYLVRQLESRLGGNSDGNNEADSNHQAVLLEILAMDARGNVTEQRDGLNHTIVHSYHPDTGMLTGIQVSQANGGSSNAIQHISYQHDALGNLRQRHNLSSNIEEDFSYDGFNRLTQANGHIDLTLQYHANGNIKRKSDVQNNALYQYHPDKIHAVQQLSLIHI